MKKTLYTLLSAAMLIALFAFNGCKDKITDPVVDKTIPNDVFPLTAGNRFEYSGYFTNAPYCAPKTAENGVAGFPRIQVLL